MPASVPAGMHAGTSVSAHAAAAACAASPRAEEADVDCGCNCAAGMLGALELLCDPRLAPLVDYNQFAFFTPNFVLGTSLNCPGRSYDRV